MLFYLACAIGVIAIFAVLFYAAGRIMAAQHGDCNIFLDTEEISERRIEKDGTSMKLYFDIPFKNTGKQHGLIIDCDARLQPKGDIFRFNEISCRVINKSNVRFDGYWEGLVLKPSKTAVLRVILSVAGKFNEEDFENFTVDILARYYGRGLMKFKRTEIKLALKDFVKSESPIDLAAMFPDAGKKQEREVPADIKSLTVPVRTHILMPGEKLSDIIEKYVKPEERKHIFTIAESALAIIQGRVYYVDDVNPGPLAVHLSHFFKMDSSLSSPYSMKKAMDEAGALRIIAAVIIGMIGRCIGRSGDFYRVAGKDVTVIDDCTGTLPPFDKYIVMGPADMKKEMERVKEETGMDAAIIDANDLHKVDVLTQTGDLKAHLERAMEYNPAGNGNEQTPIVLIKKS
ncbi:MAG: coenzyme F420-0:L-glutamate ligase [bacterium]|nr:coenzyme F420-0:L-glutamate ligase [bacterium]